MNNEIEKMKIIDFVVDLNELYEKHGLYIKSTGATEILDTNGKVKAEINFIKGKYEGLLHLGNPTYFEYVGKKEEGKNK